MFIKQISVFLENKRGSFRMLTELLGKKVTAVSMPQSTAALGAALRARKMWEAEQAKQ